MQHFINDFLQNGKNRTAQKIALLLSAVLDYAVDDGIIERSPMKRVVVARHEQESGQSLTREEERKLLAAFRSSPDVSAIKALSPGVLTKPVKDFLPSHHLHDLRHTFITRAQECGIKRELVSLWAGHAADSSITSTVYTHLEQNEEHQIAQMRLFSYD